MFKVHYKAILLSIYLFLVIYVIIVFKPVLNSLLALSPWSYLELCP